MNSPGDLSSRMPKVLILLPNNLGDVIMATPVLEGFHAKYPDSAPTFFVEEGFQAGLVGNPYCGEIHTFPRARIRDYFNLHREKHGGKELHDHVSQLRQKQFDLIINLSQIDYVSFLTGCLGGRRVVGRRFLPEGNHAVPDEWTRYLYAIPYSRRRNMLHAIDIYRRIADVPAPSRLRISLSRDEISRAREIFRSIGVEQGRPVTLFQPGAATGAKRWPIENFIALGRSLRESGRQIVVSGAPSEKELAEAVARGIGPGAYVLAGRTTFREGLGCFVDVEACVTGDTAIMHAAAALDVPVFALFGATSPVETGPYGDGHWVFSSRCSSRPCFCRDCKSMICMKSILPETVQACMLEKKAPSDPKCDIYRTGFTSAKDYRLIPVTTDRDPYIDNSGARATLRGMGENVTADPFSQNPEVTNAQLTECRAMISHLQSMENILRIVEAGGEADELKRFEEEKRALETYSEIGSFWAAYLNIGLNSVPIMDLRSAVEQSRKVCADTRMRVVRSLEYLDEIAQSSSSSS